MPLPKRPAPYILTLLLVLLAALAAWMYHAVTSPELRRAIWEQKQLHQQRH